MINVSVNDTSNNRNSTLFNVTVNDSKAPTFNQTITNIILEFGTTLTLNINSTDPFFDKYSSNDTSNFTINATTGFFTNVSNISLGIHMINVTVNDTSNNKNSTLFNVTVSDTVAPIFSGINVSIVTNQSVTINWSTSQNANGTVKYGTTLALGTNQTNTSFLGFRSMNITGLAAGTFYYFNLTSCDPSNNCQTNGTFNFTTVSNGDVTPPVVLSVTVYNITNQSAIVNWTTNEVSNSSINYGTTVALGTNRFIRDSVTDHMINLTALVNSTLHFFNLTSCDASGNCITNGTLNFTTNNNSNLIEFDNNSSKNGTSVSYLELNHTVGTQSNRILIVGTGQGQNSVERSVVSITYAGLNFVKITSQDRGGFGNLVRAELWYLVNPPSGNNLINVTWDGSDNHFMAGAISLANVHQSAPLGKLVQAGGCTVGANSLDVGTLFNYSWVVDVIDLQDKAPVTVGAGQTERWHEYVSPTAVIEAAGSTENTTVNGTVTMSWTPDGCLGHIAQEIKLFSPNNPPTAPNLTRPNNGNNTLTTLNVSFSWENSTDADNNNITYDLNLTSQLCANQYFANISGTNFTSPELSTVDQCGYYNWSVRAYDGFNYSTYSPTFNFSISSLVSITLIQNTSNFGYLAVTQTNDTADNNPQPFIVQSDSNVQVNITIRALNDLWNTSGLGNTTFRYKANTTNESGSFAFTKSQTTYTPVTRSATFAVGFLNFTNASDTAGLDLEITVPNSEPPGNRSSTVIVGGLQS